MFIFVINWNISNVNQLYGETQNSCYTIIGVVEWTEDNNIW